jgi:type I restriction enzyme S subunit
MTESKAKKSGLEFEVPNGWNVFELEKVVDFLDGKRKPIKDSDRAKIKGVYPYYGASGIIDHVNDFIFDEELILLGEDGANILNRSTPLAFKVSGKIWVNNHAHVLKPKKGTDIDFLTEFLESIKYDKYNTGTAQPKLNKEVCCKIPVLLPPLPEQRAISQVLGTIDQAIQTTERLIAQKELRKKWLMQQLLTGKIRLKGFNGEWKKIKVKKVGQIPEKNPVAELRGQRLLTVKLHTKGIEFNDSDKPIISQSGRPYYERYEGEILIGRQNIHNGGIGVVQKEHSGHICSNAITSFKVHETYSMEFLLYYLQHPDHYKGIETFMGGTGQKELSEKQFLNLEITIPLNLEEQTAIASLLQTADHEINLLKTKAEKLREQKKGMMQVLLTGKVRVKVDHKENQK